MNDKNATHSTNTFLLLCYPGYSVAIHVIQLSRINIFKSSSDIELILFYENRCLKANSIAACVL